MNIFILSWNVIDNASLYIDKHCVKIILEIVQMLYTTCHIYSVCMDDAPYIQNGTQRGYKKVSNINHPMVIWVRSSIHNYNWVLDMGFALVLEYNRRYGKIHGCTKHLVWLDRHRPDEFVYSQSSTAFYSETGFPDNVTPPPQCMPDEFKDLNCITANHKYYKFKRHTIK